MKLDQNNETRCIHCHELIRTGNFSQIKQLKQSSFLYQQTCNKCATNKDLKEEIICLKREKIGYRAGLLRDQLIKIIKDIHKNEQ